MLISQETLDAVRRAQRDQKKRMKRFELSTLSLARRCSTTELHPQIAALEYPLRPIHHALLRYRWSIQRHQITYGIAINDQADGLGLTGHLLTQLFDPVAQVGSIFKIELLGCNLHLCFQLIDQLR